LNLIACGSTIGITLKSALSKGVGELRFRQHFCAIRKARHFSTTLLLKVYRNFIAIKKSDCEVAFLSHPLRDVRVTFALHLYLVGKRMTLAAESFAQRNFVAHLFDRN